MRLKATEKRQDNKARSYWSERFVRTTAAQPGCVRVIAEHVHEPSHWFIVRSYLADRSQAERGLACQTGWWLEVKRVVRSRTSLSTERKTGGCKTNTHRLTFLLFRPKVQKRLVSALKQQVAQCSDLALSLSVSFSSLKNTVLDKQSYTLHYHYSAAGVWTVLD